MTTGPGTVSVLEIASPLPFIARRSPQATQLQRRVLGVRAGPHPVLTLGAMKHTRPFIARRPGPGVAGETAPGAGANRAPALAPAVANGDPSTRSGSGSRNRKRTLSSIRRYPRSAGDFRDSRAGMRVAGPHKLSQAHDNLRGDPGEHGYGSIRATSRGSRPTAVVRYGHE